MFRERLKELTSVIYNCVCTEQVSQISHSDALERAQELLHGVNKRNGKVYLVGEGGSSGIASHTAADLINRLHVPAITLFDSNLMTCSTSNEKGYQNVFSGPLKILINEEDLLLAISSTGTSSNILQSVEVAKSKGAKVLTFSGFKPTNPLRYLGDLNLWIESEDYGIVENAHFFLLHTIIDFWSIDTEVEQKEADPHILV